MNDGEDFFTFYSAEQSKEEEDKTSTEKNAFLNDLVGGWYGDGDVVVVL